MLTMNAVMKPKRSPAYHPAYEPTVAPIKVINLIKPSSAGARPEDDQPPRAVTD
jgi:hypothetical protein